MRAHLPAARMSTTGKTIQEFPIAAMKLIARLLRLISLCVLALGLAACSALKLGYGQLPELSYWWIDAYIDTSDAQSPQLRRELDSLLTWHRAEELPRYVRLLQKMQAIAPHNLTAEQTCAVFDDVRTRYLVLQTRAEAPALWLGQSLTPAQIAHMQRKFEKNNAEWRGDWLDGTPQERLKRREKLATSRAEMFYGKLNDAQQAALRAELAQSAMNPELMWKERQRRQQDMIRTMTLLSATPAMQPEAARSTLNAMLTRLSASPDPAWRAYSETTVREACAGFARLHNLATPAQRERAAQKLKGYEDDLRALMAPPA